MEIKIIIIRKVTEVQKSLVEPLLFELHSLAWRSDGYISGETLINVDDLEERIVISSWKSHEDWNAYRENPETQEIHTKVDQILGKATEHKVYRHK